MRGTRTLAGKSAGSPRSGLGSPLGGAAPRSHPRGRGAGRSARREHFASCSAGRHNSPPARKRRAAGRGQKMRTDEEEFTAPPENKRKHAGTSKHPPKRRVNKTLMAIKEEVEEEIKAEASANAVPEGPGGQMNPPAELASTSGRASASKVVPQEPAFYTSKALSDLKLLFRRVKSNQ